MIVELNKLRVKAVTLTSMLLALRYNTNIKADLNFNNSQLYTKNSKVAIALALFYYQINTLKNIEPSNDIREILKSMPIFISFKDSIKKSIWIEIENIFNKDIANALQKIYTMYNVDIANVLLEAKNCNDNTEKNYLNFISHFSVMCKNIILIMDVIDEFILKYEPFAPVEELYMASLSEHKYIENDAMNLNFNTFLKVDANNYVSIDDSMNDFLNKLLYIYFKDYIDSQSTTLNTYLALAKSEAFNSLLGAEIIKKYNFDKEDILYKQLEALEQKISSLNLKEIIRDEEITDIDSLYSVTNNILKKYIDFIPNTDDNNLRIIRNKELARIANKLKNNILETLDIISTSNNDKKEIDDEKNIANSSDFNNTDNRREHTDSSREREESSWSNYSESELWRT